LGESFSIEVLNRVEAIAPAMEAAERWLEKKRAGPKTVYFANLAIEEIVTNCIRYGYEDTGEHRILIVLGVAGGALTLQTVDDGRAFDPLAAPKPDLSEKLESRIEGGLGIHLLRSLADEMTYERVDGHNRITLVKALA
jgi:serine/threonine-protein kinase RsbW